MSTFPVLPHHHDANEEALLRSLPRLEDLQNAADTMKILSDPLRMQLFWILCHCEECVTNLAALVGMSAPAVSHHLRVLKDNDLVTTRRAGKEMHYRSKDTPLAHMLHHSIEEIVHITCPTVHIHPHWEEDQ